MTVTVSEQGPGFKLLGGSLCVDFANTVDWRLSENPIELLDTYQDLLEWSREAHALTADEAAALKKEAGRNPSAASGVLAKAMALRETVYRALLAVEQGREVDTGDLAALNAALSEAMSKLRLLETADGLTWAWAEPHSLERMLWPVARSAADLLTSPEIGLLRMCADPECGWLFVDRSKNKRRAWCSMQSCGNRAKARRFYERSKARKGKATGNETAVSEPRP